MMDTSHEYDETEPHTGTFQWYLERRAATNPGAQAYTYSPLGLVDAHEEHATWNDLNVEASQLATQLAADGVEHGDYVATLFPPSPPFAVVYFAAAKLGATLVPLDLRGTPTEHDHVLSATNPTAFLGADRYRDTNFEAIVTQAPSFSDIETVYWLSDDWRASLPTEHDYTWTVRTPSGEPARRTQPGCSDPDTPLLVVFTSGTTGDPKGAVLTHRNVVFQGTAIATTWEIDDTDSVLVHLPTDHVGGATELMGSAVVGGSTMVFLDAFDPAAALSRIEDHDITVLGNVPAMWGMLFNHEDYDDTDLRSLKVGIVAGQAPSEDILYGMDAAAENAVTGWGLTETGGFVTLTAIGTSVSEMTDSVGAPFPGFEIRTLDEDGALQDASETGEIVVRGDGVMDRFLLDEQTAAAFVDDEWVRTGDLGFVGDDGDLRLRGRKKNMYISGGYNVYPPEIEDVLTDHATVDQAMVIGIEHDEWGEAGHAFVLTQSPLDRSTLEEYVDDELAAYKQPVDYTITSELPLTSLGKIDRQAIIETSDLDTV